MQLVGDDVFVTNPEILKRGIDEKVGNALLVKVNQIGTVTETLDAMAMARDAEYALHRVAPLGRNRGRHDRRPRRGDQRRPDQDRIGQPHRSRGQVQPAAAHRRSARQQARPRTPAAGHPSARERGHERHEPADRWCSSCSTAGACATSANTTPSSWHARRPTPSCSSDFRIRRLRPRAKPSGLPAGQMGNSEVGHMTMGAGRVVYQDLTRIDKSIRDGDFFEKPALLDADRSRAKDGKQPCTWSGWCRRTASTATSSISTRSSKWRRASRRRARVRARASPTAATRRRRAAPGSSASSSA